MGFWQQMMHIEEETRAAIEMYIWLKDVATVSLVVGESMCRIEAEKVYVRALEMEGLEIPKH